MEAMTTIDHKYSSSYSWWFNSHNNDSTQRRGSPWLHDTLAELEETTMAMLNIIEEDGDSFAKRAEMYYKKRPELIGAIKNMYVSHRSLAEEIDKLKSEAGSRVVSSEKSYDSYSLESAESVLVYDLDEEDDDDEEAYLESDIAGKEQEEEISRKEREEEEEDKKRIMNEKDEEKREVIRQLTMALDSVMEENMMMRRKLAAVSMGGLGRRPTVLTELKRLKDIFIGKLFFFNGTRRTLS